MLTPDERAPLFVYCNSHSIGVCPTCSRSLTLDEIGADPLPTRGDVCPECRADLTATLRKHLAECTWMTVQMREARERAQETRRETQKIVKESRQLVDRADVLAREAEAAQRESHHVKRGQPPVGSSALAGIRILVVEPHDDVRDMLDQSLSWLGATVLAVTTARAAMARISEADIVVTDVAMDGEDGVWLWEQINLQRRPLPVIAVTGYTAEQYPRMKRARFARTLLKPGEPDKLTIVIREVLDGGSG